jgi:mono/diheme cytochrome c family protein
MKNVIVFTGLLIVFWGAAHAAEQKKITVAELFNIKCTTCHGADESFKRHATKEQFLVMIRTMQFGAKVTDQEMERIAAFLGDPTRIFFEQNCTRCHDINRIRQARLERRTDAKLRGLVEMMRKKDTSGISEQDAAAIYQYLVAFY